MSHFNEHMEWIGKAADLFVGGGEVDEDDVVAGLVSEGCNPDLAQLVVDYLPSGFAEPALEKLGASRTPTYTRNLTNGRSVECKWQDDQLWLAVQSFVRMQISGGCWARYKSIAQYAAELDAASKSLNREISLEGAVIAVAPITRLPPGSPFLPETRAKSPYLIGMFLAAVIALGLGLFALGKL